jgi:hypothetical protein
MIKYSAVASAWKNLRNVLIIGKGKFFGGDVEGFKD